MKKYIIAAATIMAINNSPTFAHETVIPGNMRSDHGGKADKGVEQSSANEKELASESTQAKGEVRVSPEPTADRGQCGNVACALAGWIHQLNQPPEVNNPTNGASYATSGDLAAFTAESSQVGAG